MKNMSILYAWVQTNAAANWLEEMIGGNLDKLGR